MHRARLVLLAAAGAVLAGLTGFAFLEALDWATEQRSDHRWTIWLLPVAGAALGATYARAGGRAAQGTPLVVREGASFDEGVPSRMAPLILGGAIAGHLVGASVGREGAGVQLAGAATDTVAARGGATAEERSQLACIAVAAGFGATFGLPITGTLFAITLCRRSRQPVVAAIALGAAFLADRTVDVLGHEHHRAAPSNALAWSPAIVLGLLALGLVAGCIARVYVAVVDRATEHLQRRIPQRWVRTAIGGAATLVVAVLWTRDALGLSLPLLDAAVGGSAADWWAPLAKFVCTVIAMATGWVGGEVVPLMVIGSTTGSVIAQPLGIPIAAASRATGVATFHAAAGTAAAGLAMAGELWGWRAIAPTAIAAVAARVAAGRPDLYHARR